MDKNINYEYDKESDSLLINIKDDNEDRFEEIIPGVNIELNKEGDIIGIEILKASRFMKKIVD